MIQPDMVTTVYSPYQEKKVIATFKITTQRIAERSDIHSERITNDLL